jgi:protease-4
MENSTDNIGTPAPQQPPPVTVNITEEKKKNRGCLWWGLGLGIFFFFISGGIFIIAMIASFISSIEDGGIFATPSPSQIMISEDYISGNNNSCNKIAVIDIRGVITNAVSSWGSDVANSDFICTQLKKAQDDPNVKAVILRLDTPGGEVTAADKIYHTVCELRKNSRKPVISSMGSVAASGGVYVAVASDYIIANKLTTTGSIGVIAQAYNYTELFKKIGLKAEVYKSGPMKDLLNGARPRTPEEVAIINEFIGEVYSQFVKIVAEGRQKLTEDQIRNTPIGDGRFYSGSKALEYGLIDQLGYFEDAVTKAASMASLKDYKVVSYQAQSGLASLLMNMKSTTPNLKLQLPGTSQRVELPKSGKFFLLPSM